MGEADTAMSLSIRTNVASLNAQRNLYSTQLSLDSSLSRLSSGFRITKAGDDAAGLGISTKLESQIRSYGQATRNANDGLSVVQASEAALNEQANILTRMRELAMQSGSDGVGNSERRYIDTEGQKLLAELQRISQVTEYNGTKLLDGSAATLDFQVGIAATTNDRISLNTLNATTAAVGAGTAATPPTGVSETSPSVGAYQLEANNAYQLGLIAGGAAQGGAGSALDLATLAAAAAGAVDPTHAAFASMRIWYSGYQTFDPTFTGGNGAANVIAPGPPTLPQQGGLHLLNLTVFGGDGGDPLLVPAYYAFASTLVSSGGVVADARSAARVTNSDAGNAAYETFLAQYAQTTGVPGSPLTVDLTSAGVVAGLKALGYAPTGGTPAVPGSGGGGGLGVAGLSLTSKASSLSALASIDAALATISSNRATLGATGNRLQSAIANIQAFSESLSAANSRIKDVDVAEETSRMSRSQILMQAGVSVLAQANQMPQMALKLLG